MSKHTWTPGEKITSARLNEIENKIANPQNLEVRDVTSTVDSDRIILNITPREMIEAVNRGTIVKLKRSQDSSNPNNFYSDYPLSVFDDNKSVNARTLIVDNTIVVPSDATADSHIPLTQEGGRSDWIVTVSVNGVSGTLTRGWTDTSNEYTYCGTVEGVDFIVSDGAIGEQAPEIWCTASAAGTYTVQITQADGVTVVAPSQTFIAESDTIISNWSQLEQTSIGYTVPALPASRMVVKVDGVQYYSHADLEGVYYNEDVYRCCKFDWTCNSCIVCYFNKWTHQPTNVEPGTYHIEVYAEYDDVPVRVPSESYSYLPVEISELHEYSTSFADSSGYSYFSNSLDEMFSRDVD